MMSDDEREVAIRVRAYAIWEQEGRPDSGSLAHWLKAEAEIESAKEPSTATRAKRSKPVDQRQPQLLMPVAGGRAKKPAVAAKPTSMTAPTGRRRKVG
jgi:hypothetical protein